MTEKEEILAEEREETTPETEEQSAEEKTEEQLVGEEHCCEGVEQLEREKAQLTQQLLRLKADFENFKRRTQMQLENIRLEANEKLLKDLLPVLDNFERALQANTNTEDPFYQGVEMVYQGLMNSLANHGLKPIEAVGHPFDPNFHEAVAMQGDGDADLQVLAQVQTGYLLHNKVLRHTKVLVGQSEEEEQCQK